MAEAFEAKSGGRPQRSGLVTGLAWVSIAVCSLLLALLAMELVAVFWLLGPEAITPDMLGPDMPSGLVFVVRYLREISLSLAILTGVGLWASICLLQRKNWARWFFAIVLVLSAVGNFAGVFLLPEFIPSPLAMFGAQLPAPLLVELEATMRNMMWASLGSSVLFLVLHGWVVWKLVTAPISEEFA